MAPGLVRVSVAAGSRRADLAMPGAVPVAELLPELGRALGVPPGPGGLAIATADGRPLLAERSLAAQDVPEGSVLVLSADRPVAPLIHDDEAEAVAEAVEEYVAAWPPWAGRCAALVAAAMMLATAAGLALDGLAARAPVAARCLVAFAALGVLAGSGFPRWALALVAGRASDCPVDVERVRADVRAAHAVLLGLVVAGGLALLAAAPTAVGLGPCGAPLVVDVAAVLALRGRRHHSGAECLAALVAALGTVLTTATVAAAERPGWAPSIVLGAVGLVVLAGALLRPTPRRDRALELLEAASLVAVLPLLVAATGVLGWVHALVAR